MSRFAGDRLLRLLGADRPGSGYRPALDGYRGLFILMVMGYHFGIRALAGGWVGINHFFVFSGFLIGRILIKEHYRTGTVSARAFYLRRVRRIVPAMAALVVVVLGWTALHPDSPRREFAGDGFSTLTFWLNWRLIARNDQYFDNFDAPSPLRHVWTLAVEEQFYLLVPWLILLLFLVTRRRMMRFAIVVIAALLATAWSAHLVGQPDITSSRIYYGTDVRMQALLVGFAAAFLFTRRRPGPALALPAGVAEALGWIGTIISIGAFFVLDDNFTAAFGNGTVLLFAIAAAVMGVSATDPRPLLINRIFSWPPLVYLGQISYGLYLFHWPISLWMPLTGWSLPLAVAVKFLLTLAVATLSFRFLEYPVLRDGFRALWPWRTGRRYAGFSVFAGLVAMSLVLTAAVADPRIATYEGPPLNPHVVYAAPVKPVSVAMIGDSIPTSLQDGFIAGRYPGFKLLPYARIEGCDAIPVTLEVAGHQQADGPSCAAWRQTWPDQVRRSGAEILLAPAGLRFLFPLRIDGKVEAMGSPASQRLLRRNLDALLVQYQRSGAKQLQIVNVPCRLLTPQQLSGAYRAALGEKPKPIDTTWSNRLISGWAQQHTAEGVRVLDLNGQLCGDGYHGAINGTQLYKDGAHFTPAGAQLVWTWLAPTVLRTARPSSG
ncbi:acyltransferase family protein [Calidifontibacter terrae]